MQSYIFLVPLIGWFAAGFLKTLINFCYHKNYDLRLTFSNGGFPSAHTTTVITVTSYIGFHDNFSSTIFLLAECVSFIVIIDATHLRRAIGKHAAMLNKLNGRKSLYEREGHSYIEVFAGIVIGFIVGYLCFLFIQ